MSVDLTEVPTSELVAELENRSVVSVIGLIMPETPDTTTTKTWYRGNDFTKYGLAQSMSDRLRGKIQSELEPADETD